MPLYGAKQSLPPREDDKGCSSSRVAIIKIMSSNAVEPKIMSSFGLQASSDVTTEKPTISAKWVS